MKEVLMYLAIMAASVYWMDAALNRLAGCASEAECKALVTQAEERNK